MSARTRTCLGCEGTGCKVQWESRPSYDCPACLGSGTVSEPDTRKDALVDVEALELNCPYLTEMAGQFGDLAAVMAGKGIRAESGVQAKHAASAAFRAVPALKALALAGMLLLLPGAAQAGDRVGSYAVWCGAKAADLASTERALARGGTHEANGLMQDRGVRFGAGAAVCAAVSELDHRYFRGHTKSRWALRIVGVGLMAYAVQNNERRGR